MTTDSTGALLWRHHANADWGDPVDAEAWFDASGSLRVCRAVYRNAKLVTLRRSDLDYRIEFQRYPAALPKQDAPNA